MSRPDEPDDPPAGAPGSGAGEDSPVDGPEPAARAATPRARPGLPPAHSIALVAVGGAVGAVVRTAQSAAFPPTPGQLPWSTLVENVAGAFLLGLLLTLLTERLRSSPWPRPLLATGALGAYTTYATVGLELHHLVDAGALAVALGYLTGTALLGLAAGGAGIALGRWLPGRPR